MRNILSNSNQIELTFNNYVLFGTIIVLYICYTTPQSPEGVGTPWLSCIEGGWSGWRRLEVERQWRVMNAEQNNVLMRRKITENVIIIDNLAMIDDN